MDRWQDIPDCCFEPGTLNWFLHSLFCSPRKLVSKKSPHSRWDLWSEQGRLHVRSHNSYQLWHRHCKVCWNASQLHPNKWARTGKRRRCQREDGWFKHLTSLVWSSVCWPMCYSVRLCLTLVLSSLLQAILPLGEATGLYHFHLGQFNRCGSQQ